ncbi:MAG: helix-turn-helix transcriptional regulator [Oscillospiraceae bacterium]|jgi:transcriptional regulator with XRE-family HTH domain|nr:helix-turn-helix transcriptional regulator [Oscillospiraceae bacterium]
MPDDILVRLGLRLKEARESREMTQQRLSDLSGIAVRTISKIERGQMNPSFEILSILIPYLCVSLDSLFVPSDSKADSDFQEISILYQSSSKEAQRLILTVVRALYHELKINSDGI